MVFIEKQANGLYSVTEHKTGFSLDNLTELEAWAIKRQFTK